MFTLELLCDCTIYLFRCVLWCELSPESSKWFCCWQHTCPSWCCPDHASLIQVSPPSCSQSLQVPWRAVLPAVHWRGSLPTTLIRPGLHFTNGFFSLFQQMQRCILQMHSWKQNGFVKFYLWKKKKFKLLKILHQLVHMYYR